MITKIPNPIDKHVGKRLRMRRQTLGMTQRSLGTALGVKFQQIQNYEKARNRIGSSRLHQVAATLKVTPEFFFEDAPKSQTDRSRRNVAPSPDPIPHDARWYRIGQGVHAHRYEASPTDCRSRADTDQHGVSGDEDQLKRLLQLDASLEGPTGTGCECID
jgi:transcriptional regulator with XRE-family HTH domain